MAWKTSKELHGWMLAEILPVRACNDRETWRLRLTHLQSGSSLVDQGATGIVSPVHSLFLSSSTYCCFFYSAKNYPSISFTKNTQNTVASVTEGAASHMNWQPAVGDSFCGVTFTFLKQEGVKRM